MRIHVPPARGAIAEEVTKVTFTSAAFKGAPFAPWKIVTGWSGSQRLIDCQTHTGTQGTFMERERRGGRAREREGQRERDIESERDRQTDR